MLKIKDEVDLKELEKFGFKIDEIDNYQVYQLEIKLKDDKKYFNECTIFIKPISREIIIGGYYDCYNIPSIIYDLIQAGLVEKVEK